MTGERRTTIDRLRWLTRYALIHCMGMPWALASGLAEPQQSGESRGRPPTLFLATLGAVCVLFLQLTPAAAEIAVPKFVATTGDDANNCSSPATACETLQRAHDVAVSGDSIIVLDSGDFEAVTITKSIAIAAVGVDAELFTGPTTKIMIDAGPDDVIDIDGLTLRRNAPSGTNSGIEFISGGRLNVRNCTIRNFSKAGIFVGGSGPAKRVVVSDSIIADNQIGIWARRGNRVFLDRVTVVGSVGAGVLSEGGRTRVRIHRSTVTNNGKGLNVLNGGRIISFGTNAIHGNAGGIGPTQTVPLK